MCRTQRLDQIEIARSRHVDGVGVASPKDKTLAQVRIFSDTSHGGRQRHADH